MIFDQIRLRIESIMYERDGEKGQAPLKALLYGVSKLYGGVQAMRRECYRRKWYKSFRLPCKVVSVGNLAVGGTGKTPMTAYLARAFRQMGKRVVVIRRGYKGRGGSAPLVVSDGHQVLMDSLQSGDEAQMLARQLMPVPVLTGADRYQTGMVALDRFKPDVIILDDGFQHIRLQRNLDLVLLDSEAPLGNGHLLPRGLLREPVKVLKAADGIIFTRSSPERVADAGFSDFIPPGMPVFKSTHKPYHFLQNRGENIGAGFTRDPAASQNFTPIQGSRLAVFSGIARNDDFQRVLAEYGAELLSTHTFSDHHRYTRPELTRIAAAARAAEADLLVTTEKDFMRLPMDFQWPLDLMVVGVEIDFGKQDGAFRQFLQSRIGV